MEKQEQKMQVPKISLDDLFTTQEQRDDNKLEKVVDVRIDNIDDFPNHPFKVVDNDEMEQMKESIIENGVLMPVLVRPKNDGRYELVSGHRRKFASELALKETIPCIVRNLSDDEVTSVQVEQKLENNNSRKQISNESGISEAQVFRYIRLTYLIQELLDKVDNKEIELLQFIASKNHSFVF